MKKGALYAGITFVCVIAGEIIGKKLGSPDLIGGMVGLGVAATALGIYTLYHIEQLVKKIRANIREVRAVCFADATGADTFLFEKIEGRWKQLGDKAFVKWRVPDERMIADPDGTIFTQTWEDDFGSQQTFTFEKTEGCWTVKES